MPCSFLLSYKTNIQNALTMELPQRLWLVWLLYNILISLFSFDISLLGAMVIYGPVNIAIRMEPVLILMAQCLTWTNNYLA